MVNLRFATWAMPVHPAVCVRVRACMHVVKTKPERVHEFNEARR